MVTNKVVTSFGEIEINFGTGEVKVPKDKEKELAHLADFEYTEDKAPAKAPAKAEAKAPAKAPAKKAPAKDEK